MFNSLQEFKERSEFFKAGSIVPQRVLKGPRKVKHRVKFLCDVWRFSHSDKYVIYAHAPCKMPKVPGSGDGNYYIKISNVRNGHFITAPYRENCPVYTVYGTGDNGVAVSEQEVLNKINSVAVICAQVVSPFGSTVDEVN